jgi:hypothetical protein
MQSRHTRLLRHAMLLLPMRLFTAPRRRPRLTAGLTILIITIIIVITTISRPCPCSSHCRRR